MISTQASHPAFAAHPIQGWTPDFIPKVLEDAPMAELQDELFPIPGDAAVNTAKALAAKEGLLTGISGGGTMYAALETAKKAPKGSVILAMLPDTGERYLSTPLFDDVPADMTADRLGSCRPATPTWRHQGRIVPRDGWTPADRLLGHCNRGLPWRPPPRA